MKTINLTAKGLLYLPIIAFALLTSCQKDVNPQPGEETTSSREDFRVIQSNDASVATDWYNLQLSMILKANPALSPLAVNRMFGYMGISLFEAARFTVSNSISLSGQINEMPVMPTPEPRKKYSWEASANAAMANIIRDMFPALTTANHASIDSLEKVYNDKVIASDGADVLARSQEFGDSVASKIFAWSKTDMFNHIGDPYTPPVGPGLWVPTAPAFAPAAGPYAGNCRTFLKRHEQTNILPMPFSYSEKKNSAFYKMASYNYLVSKTMNEDEKNIALFWNDNGAGISYTPMGHNISIITQILTNSHANLAKAGQAYVRAGMAMWDATVICWRGKYTHNLLRPITYIQKNIDPAWTSFIITPPHPEYPAAHAFITSAVMQQMNTVFGYSYPFTDHTYDFLGYPTRSYSNFEHAAVECGLSRVYGGIHYKTSVDIAHTYGSLVGEDMSRIKLVNNP